MRGEALEALSRTARLINLDVFGGEVDEAAIVEGLQATTVRLVADETNLASAAGQTAAVALFGLIAMMGIGVDLDLPDVELVSGQPPLRGDRLRASMLDLGMDLIPGVRMGVGIARPDLVIVLGDTPWRGRPALRISGDAWSCRLDEASSFPGGRWKGDWPIGPLAGAGAAAAEAFRAALPKIAAAVGMHIPRQPWWHLDFERRVDLDLAIPGYGSPRADVGRVDFVSAGAITMAAMYTLVRIPDIRGRLRVVEPESIELSNLNRYALARRSDCGRGKAELLAALTTPGLEVVAVPRRFEGGPIGREGSLAPRVMVGVDHIPSRWAVQSAAEGWVCVGATSHEFAMVSTHRPDQPCAGCAHPGDEPADGPIPTISFVSFWAGLMQARALLAEANGTPQTGALYVWPFGLFGPRALQSVPVAIRPNCPVRCQASKQARSGLLGA